MNCISTGRGTPEEPRQGRVPCREEPEATIQGGGAVKITWFCSGRRRRSERMGGEGTVPARGEAVSIRWGGGGVDGDQGTTGLNAKLQKAP
jgi:hypothetical protein